MNFKIKIIIVLIYILILIIIINILHIYFFEQINTIKEDLKSLPDNLSFIIEYYSREIIKTTLDYNNYTRDKNIISTEDIRIKLKNIDYHKINGELKMTFDFCMNDEQSLDDVRFKIRIYDKKYIFYEKQIGNIFYIDNYDYLFYNEKFCNKVIDKKLDTSKLNENSKFETFKSEDGTYQMLELNFDLGKNYEIQDSLNIDFLNLTYRPLGDFLYKAIDSLGEFKFVVEF